MGDSLMLVFLVVIVVVGCGILFIVTQSRGKSNQLDVERYRTSWLTIERQLVKGEESSCHLVILNADKLLDKALKQRGYKGETMGDRMKSAKDAWSNANNVWTAHKLRNRVAHESDITIGHDTTRKALAAYKQGLKDMGAI